MTARQLDLQTSRAWKNGRLLEAAEAADFDVLITVDQNIPDQQHFETRTISVLILCAATNRLPDLKPLVPAAHLALASIGLGKVLRIEWNRHGAT